MRMDGGLQNVSVCLQGEFRAVSVLILYNLKKN